MSGHDRYQDACERVKNELSVIQKKHAQGKDKERERKRI
jgi:hypothetical protein